LFDDSKSCSIELSLTSRGKFGFT